MEKTVYELMHGEKVVADIGTNGVCTVLDRAFLPFSIYLEDTAENDDLDIRMDNLTNFYYWCATRVLTLDRVYAKEILNSIGALQAQTDRDRAKIALSYHCLSLTDIFWVREKGENITFSQINLFENHLDNALVDISLRGKQMTVENSYQIADDLSTNGVFPKAWIREKNSFSLLKMETAGLWKMKSCQVRSAAVLTADRCSMRKVCLTDRKFQKAGSLRRWITAWYQWRHLKSMQQIMTFTLWISC